MIPANTRQRGLFGDYGAFLESHAPKKTSDDCYTPPNVYEAVRAWVFARYGLAPDTPVVRPFYPGGDYEAFDYAPGCVVVDNPPFSMSSKIYRHYRRRGVRFFLFAPFPTLAGFEFCTVVAPVTVRYANGAEVSTSFVTNLAPEIAVETAPDLRRAIMAADAENRRAARKPLPKYSLPDAVLTAAGAGYLCSHGVRYALRREDCGFIRTLDAMSAAGKALFGGGFLLTERAAAERAAAERAAAERAAAERAAVTVWALSDREREMQKMMARKEKEDKQ